MKESKPDLIIMWMSYHYQHDIMGQNIDERCKRVFEEGVNVVEIEPNLTVQEPIGPWGLWSILTGRYRNISVKDWVCCNQEVFDATIELLPNPKKSAHNYKYPAYGVPESIWEGNVGVFKTKLADRFNLHSVRYDDIFSFEL